MPDERDPGPSIGWLRAVVTTVVILAVGIGGLVYGANAVLTRANRLTRSGQVAIVAPSFFVGLALLGYLLRRLQSRKVI